MRAINWTKLDFLALVLIPVQFLVAWVIVSMQIPNVQNTALIVMFALVLLSAFILAKIYGTVLMNDWANYRKKIWLKILVSLVGAACIVAVLHVVRLLMSQFMPVSSGSAVSE
ncbi:MAG: hypothetical protein FWC20_10210, partial [Oscillospiraceae bacterium]|nr:hypothetical protein [Oscillospiraceae bacterium]MCL2279761.1 hypothetical protein [Oscillospiraceae bacterium]